MLDTELPKLNYNFDALEPYIDAETMEIHYSKHHKAYLEKFLAALDKYSDLKKNNPQDIIKKLNSFSVEEKDRLAIKNFGGGYLNHNLYWQIMDPNNKRDERLIDELEKNYGSLNEFKKLFNNLAISHFGSGWTWLVRDEKGVLQIYSLPNQDSPLTLGHEPILTVDLWEHAYYLKYQNRRSEYIENWWQTIKII